jgi:hypothetical protein
MFILNRLHFLILAYLIVSLQTGSAVTVLSELGHLPGEVVVAVPGWSWVSSSTLSRTLFYQSISNIPAGKICARGDEPHGVPDVDRRVVDPVRTVCPRAPVSASLPPPSGPMRRRQTYLIGGNWLRGGTFRNQAGCHTGPGADVPGCATVR